MRRAWLAEGHDTKFCIMVEGGDLWVVIQRSKVAIRRNSVPRYGSGSCDTQGRTCRAHVAGALCRDTIFVSRPGRLRHGRPRRCDMVRQRVHARSDTAGHDHYTAPSSRCVHGLGAVCLQCACSQGPLGVHPMHPTQF